MFFKLTQKGMSIYFQTPHNIITMKQNNIQIRYSEYVILLQDLKQNIGILKLI